MASSACVQPVLKLGPPHSYQPKKRPFLARCSFVNPNPSPIPFSLAKVAIFSKRPSSFSCQRLRFTVGAQREYSSGEEAGSPVSDASNQETFSWASVILPFLFPALAGLLFGYDIGATSGATISLQSPQLSGTTWFKLSAIQLGLVVSGSLYGALLGSLLVYPIADFLGRRRELISAALLYGLGALITALAPDLGVLLAGRLLYGLGHAWGSPLYCRNLPFSNTWNSNISLGTFHSSGNFVNFQINAIGGWRYMYVFSAPIALLMGLGMWSLPPSPRWLLLRAIQGKGPLLQYKKEATLALSKLRGRSPNDEASERQIEDTLISISFGPISWLMVSEIFPLRTRGKGISLAVLTNFGSNAIVTFAFSPLKELLGADNLFLLFGAIALLSLLFVALYVPETKGLSLEEIESKILN
ncbi:hypothetical protein SLEP1_g41505 [Rubroshorea leprosula]|uniref:Major facilitator superfamily (MFS) profile domain-containing protein n=1 Tax=Rubroshorea leprosula TaxID=152421 RepID=A0AAV5L717_9ROSI|nr:hypothetical protein SLEP1_g41505 [Rubroshorea leprosula]